MKNVNVSLILKKGEKKIFLKQNNKKKRIVSNKKNI